MTDAAPLETHRETVRADWVDYNGHMNVAYYVLVFDHATDGLLDRIGLDAAHRERTGQTVFVAEAHVTYDSEVHEGARVRITTQVLDGDAKRLHVFHRMIDAATGKLAATNELMILHVDLASRRVAPFGADIGARIDALVDRHRALAWPDQAGRTIAIKRA